MPTPANPPGHPPTAEDLAALHEEVQSLRRQLLVASRLATLGTMAASVAHEFNNILVPIVGYAQLAEQTLKTLNPDLALVQKAVAKASSGGDKAGRICSAMLGFARDTAGDGAMNAGQAPDVAADLARVIEDAMAVVARDPNKDGVKVNIDVPPGLWAKIDAIHAEQVVINLVLNAMQALLAPATSAPSGARPARHAAGGDGAHLRPVLFHQAVRPRPVGWRRHRPRFGDLPADHRIGRGPDHADQLTRHGLPVQSPSATRRQRPRSGRLTAKGAYCPSSRTGGSA